MSPGGDVRGMTYPVGTLPPVRKKTFSWETSYLPGGGRKGTLPCVPPARHSECAALSHTAQSPRLSTLPLALGPKGSIPRGRQQLASRSKHTPSWSTPLMKQKLESALLDAARLQDSHTETDSVGDCEGASSASSASLRTPSRGPRLRHPFAGRRAERARPATGHSLRRESLALWGRPPTPTAPDAEAPTPPPASLGPHKYAGAAPLGALRAYRFPPGTDDYRPCSADEVWHGHAALRGKAFAPLLAAFRRRAADAAVAPLPEPPSPSSWDGGAACPLVWKYGRREGPAPLYHPGPHPP